MPRETNIIEVSEFIHKYYKENGYTPKLSDWKVKNGFPCNKEKLLKICGKYNDLINLLGYETYTYGKRRYNKYELLKELKETVLTYRSVDYKILKANKNLKHRDTYTNVFGSFRKALRECGITNNEIYLLKMYDDYEMEDPKEFIINKIFNNNIPNEANKLIAEGKKLIADGVKPIREEFNKKISIRKIYKYFIRFPIFIIMCDAECSLSNKQQYKANDGHLCDSYGESIIDDLLCSYGIKHEVHCSYPNSNLVSDFKVNNVFIEYTGYSHHNEHSKKYIKQLERKRKLAKDNNLIILEVNDTHTKTLDRFIQRLLLEIVVE